MSRCFKKDLFVRKRTDLFRFVMQNASIDKVRNMLILLEKRFRLQITFISGLYL